MGDVLPLTQIYGKLSNHIIDWNRVWFNSQIEDVKNYVCNPYLIGLLSLHVHGKKSNGLEVYIEFMYDEYTAFLLLDITTFIVPYICGKY